jgi:hypothetical protein
LYQALMGLSRKISIGSKIKNKGN